MTAPFENMRSNLNWYGFLVWSPGSLITHARTSPPTMTNAEMRNAHWNPTKSRRARPTKGPIAWDIANASPNMEIPEFIFCIGRASAAMACASAAEVASPAPCKRRITKIAVTVVATLYKNVETAITRREMMRIIFLLNASKAGPMKGRTRMAEIAKAPTVIPTICAGAPIS